MRTQGTLYVDFFFGNSGWLCYKFFYEFWFEIFSFFFPAVFFRLENLESLVASQQTDITSKDDKIDGLQKRYCIIVTMPEASYIASNY